MNTNVMAGTVTRLFLAWVTLTLCGCGGGGAAGETTAGGATSTAVVKVASTGTLAQGSAIGAIQATVVAQPATGLSITNDAIAVSGAGGGSTMLSNTAAAGLVTLGLLNASGIQTGELVTLRYQVAAGVTPAASDFSIAAGATVMDVSGTPLTGIGLIIESVTLEK